MKLLDVTTKQYYTPILFQLDTLIAGYKIIGRKIESNKKACELMEHAMEQYRWRSRTNNWLRIHGYPMRRRRRH